MVEEWGKKNNILVQILRIGHVYGPGEERYQKLIPVIIKQVLNNEEIKLFGEGNDIRSFIYISDVVESILTSIELKQNNEIINIVSDEQITIKAVIDKIIKLAGKKPFINKIPSSAPSRNLVFDNAKLKKFLHVPKVTLDEGLKKEIEYFRQL